MHMNIPSEKPSVKKRNKAFLSNCILIIACIALNLLLSFAARKLNYPLLPLYLDCVGTVMATMLGGVLPGVIVGISTNMLNSLFTSQLTIYFGMLNVLTAVLVRVVFVNGYMKNFMKRLLSSTVIGLIIGSISAVFTWLLYGYKIGEELSAPLAHKLVEAWNVNPFSGQLLAEIFINTADKIVAIALGYLIFILCPKKIKEILDTKDPENMEKYSLRSAGRFFRKLSGQVAVIMLAFDLVLCFAVAAICYYMYEDANIRKYTQLCQYATQVASNSINADNVDSYIKERADIYNEYIEALPQEAIDAPEDYPDYYVNFWDYTHERYSKEYIDTEKKLFEAAEVFEDLEYLYIYRIEEDGCHVVFDIDAEAYTPLVAFDESFSEMIPSLLRGEEIDPIITDDTYGWLLTVYNPLTDSDGKCVCYVCADILMTDLKTDQAIFITKVISLVIGISIVTLVITLNIFNHSMVKPIKAISTVASEFAFDTEEGQQSSIERIKNLDIRSCDEVEQLYGSLKKLSADSITYIDELEEDAKTIERLQNGMIIDFANMVESRDKNTGDHIKKTAYYVFRIAKELKKEGVFADVLTDEYIEKIVRSAPLHDIGKIKISDVILNKPGRLTEDEFEIMKTHTSEGYDILEHTTVNELDSEYLKEAENMAHYHHERWDGTGYPCKLKGDEIPLSARIMAVADVFDALVSKRSYKGPFTFEKAIEIIKEESGTHFDPQVTEAFLNISEDLRKQI